jgi:hypothetical protein
MNLTLKDKIIGVLTTVIVFSSLTYMAQGNEPQLIVRNTNQIGLHIESQKELNTMNAVHSIEHVALLLKAKGIKTKMDANSAEWNEIEKDKELLRQQIKAEMALRGLEMQ